MTNLALLRGVNLGGKNRLPMKDLAQIFDRSGCADVRTYIQSGNVVFQAPDGILEALPSRIGEQIEKQFGFRCPVILRTAKQLGDTIRNNPFLKAGADENTLHVLFLADVPGASDVRKLDPNRALPDTFAVRKRDVYLHLPNGVARTKLNNNYFDTKLATISTGRNWRTVLKLVELMESS